jgi:uncharacterized protein (TIGR02271 family)
MDSNYVNAGIREGMSVVGSDGENLGSVDQLEGDYMVVRKGLFFPSDHYIPLAAVASVEGDQVLLGATKETALQQGWDTQPVASTPTADVDSGSGAGVSGSGSLNEDDEPFEHYQDTQHTHINADDEIKVPLVAEELSAATREVERGSVDIHKDVVEERQSIDVPVTEEQVEITRRAVNRDVELGEGAFEEESVDIPLRGEEVEVDKRARVREEIDISRDAVTSTERVTDAVRREEVKVEDSGNIVTDEKGNA